MNGNLGNEQLGNPEGLKYLSRSSKWDELDSHVPLLGNGTVPGVPTTRRVTNHEQSAGNSAFGGSSHFRLDNGPYQCGSVLTMGIGASSSSSPTRQTSSTGFSAVVTKAVENALLRYTNGAERTDIDLTATKTIFTDWKTNHASTDWTFVMRGEGGTYTEMDYAATLAKWNAGGLANLYAFKDLAGFALIDKMELTVNGSEVSSLSGFSLYQICKNELSAEELAAVHKHAGGVEIVNSRTSLGEETTNQDQTASIHTFCRAHTETEFTLPTNSLGNFNSNTMIPCKPESENTCSLRVTKAQFNKIIVPAASFAFMFPMNDARDETATDWMLIPILDPHTVITCQGITKNVVSVWTNSYPPAFDHALANTFNRFMVSVYKENRVPIMTSKVSMNMVGLQGSTEKVFVGVDHNPNKLPHESGQDWTHGRLIVRTQEPTVGTVVIGAADSLKRLHHMNDLPKSIGTFKKYTLSMSSNTIMDSEEIGAVQSVLSAIRQTKNSGDGQVLMIDMPERKGIVTPTGAVSNTKYPNTILTVDMTPMFMTVRASMETTGLIPVLNTVTKCVVMFNETSRGYVLDK